MPDFEDILNLDELDAVAIEAVVWQELDEEPALDAERLEVRVTNGHVRVSGRVGTDRQHDRVVHVVRDMLDADRFDDAVRVDETLRGVHSEGADRSVAEATEAQPDLGKEAGTVQPCVPPSAPVREEEGDEQH